MATTIWSAASVRSAPTSAEDEQTSGIVADPPAGPNDESGDHGDRTEDQQDLVPAALVGEELDGGDERRTHGWESYDSSWLNGGCMRTQVEETIEAIRPALHADGGDIILRDVDEATGVVSVTLIGACGTCPASTQTLKAGIERIMRDRVDGVTEVINVELDEAA